MVMRALCGLVSEISKLRRENKALRYRLSVAAEPKRSVVHRVSAILEGRSNIIPKIMGRRTLHHCEIRNGARERLSTPPRKESLTASSYSTDVSSDVSDPLRTTLTTTTCQIPRAPPVVLPEMSDSDAEHSIFTEVALPNYGSGNGEIRGSRATMRRSKVSLVSEHTSPSSTSSRDHSENMMSNRTGFFEIIGLRKKKEKSVESKKETITCKVILKKRKRKISESTSVHSTDNNTQSDNWIISSTDSKNSLATEKSKEEESKKCSRETNSTPISEGSDESHHHRHDHHHDHHHNHHYHHHYHGRSSAAPKTILSAISSNNSAKLAVQRNRPANRAMFDNRVNLDENDMARNELTIIKNRNNQLIEQLREKSMEHSKLTTRMSTLQKQLGILRNRCRLNEALEKLSINDRIMARATATIDSVEEKLKIFDSKLQVAKAEMMKNSQAIINQSFREQNAYQACLEHIERLQQNNSSLLQDKGSDIGSDDQRIRQLLEIMPSYDALYSFTISIVRKLGQLRASYIEKNVYANRSDFEVMRAQSSLLIVHAQLERLKLQLYEATRRRPARPASYHGEDLLQKTIKPEMNFLLPFKLHESRIRKYRRSDSCAIESEVEKNEQSIENEFLRLFDYARCLSRISEFAGTNKGQLERAGTLNSGLHARDDLQNAASTIPQQGEFDDYYRTVKAAPIRHREQLLRNSANKIYTPQKNHKQSAGRPVSLHPLMNYNHTRSIVSSLQDVRNSIIHSPSFTPIMRRRVHLNERSRTIGQETLDSFDRNELAKCDTTISHNSSSSDYAIITAKQLHMEKRSAISKRPSSPSINPSRLPYLQKSINHVNSPSLISDCDGRNVCQLGRSPEIVRMIPEKNVGSTVLKNLEKSRLPKISSILAEKKKCTSWLGRIRTTK
ncbi:unnamed protein product [Litomosoides sigmodontis]|uniref:Uncharacterized protein n=1 Tax=Litomosoides sigmodontis TaxID=42156 RepID=A0A3P6TV11_LITSI|nr:unnamed protein product [Litomosoides sigmodontis]